MSSRAQPISGIKPWSYYEKHGAASSEAGSDRRVSSEVKWSAVSFAGLTALISFRMELPGFVGVCLVVIAAPVGALVGYVTGHRSEKDLRKSTAEMLYAYDWCRAHDVVFYGALTPSPGAPYMQSGERRRVSDAIRGELGGHFTTFFNVSYDVRSKLESSVYETHEFSVIQLVAPKLPVERLSIVHAGAARDLEWRGELRGRFAPEERVSLESGEFNKRFDLRIQSRADEVAIRQIFDPAAIHAIVRAGDEFPNLFFNGGYWWCIEEGHYSMRDLDNQLAKQKLAADAVELLSRVQSL